MWPFSSASSSSAKEAEGSTSACPVDHDTRQKWLQQQQDGASGSTPRPPPPGHPALSEDRVISSIPRHLAEEMKAQSNSVPSEDGDSPNSRSHWVYPSPSQFHAALMRKGHTSAASGANMDVVVPIHNAVNEKCWQEILDWERKESGVDSWKSCGGPQLVSFKGRPAERTWKAWGKALLGYQAPFDRHDWVVDRCGHRVRYIIDFYAGRGVAAGGNPFLPGASSPSADGKLPMPKMNFYLDVRPAPDSFEGIAMRFKRVGREALGMFGVGVGVGASSEQTKPAKAN